MNSLNLRFIHTHDTEANWNALVDFIPKAGELIVYDVDENNTYERFKIGDGITKLIDLPFALNEIINQLFNITDNVMYADGGRIK